MTLIFSKLYGLALSNGPHRVDKINMQVVSASGVSCVIEPLKNL
jgi:hypothetical protein